MLRNLNEGDWVALYNGDNTLAKVARIDHKFTLVGSEAKTYKKNSIEILMVRHRDRNDKSLDADGNIKCDYMMIDAATGRELRGHHHDMVVRMVPSCLNLVEDSMQMTWSDIIERQKLIYMLSDMDWKTMDLADIREIKQVLQIQHFNKHKDTHESRDHRAS
jgi:hypothetical protein